VNGSSQSRSVQHRRGIYLHYLYIVLSAAAMVVLTPVMLSYLGRTAYGVWALFTSIAGYSLLLDFGLGTAVARYTAEYSSAGTTSKLGGLVASASLLVLGIGAVVFALFALIAPFVSVFFNVPPDLKPVSQVAFVITGLNVALALFGGVLGNVIYGYQRVDIWRMCSIVQIVTIAVLSFGFLRLGFGLIGLMVAPTLATCVVVVTYIFVLKRGPSGFRPHLGSARAELLREIAPYSLRTFVLGVSSRVLYYSDYLVLGFFLGPALIVPYEVAYKLCFLSTYLFSGVSTMVFPRCVRLFADRDSEQLRELYLHVTRVSLLIMTPVAIFLICLGPAFISAWVGESNFAGMGVLLVLVVMNMLHAIGTPAAMLLQSSGRNRELMFSELINAGLNVALSIVLVTRIGLLGVALGTLLSHLCTSFWVILLLPCRSIGLSLKNYFERSVAPPLVAGLVTAAATWVLSGAVKASSFLEIAVGGVVIFVIYGGVYVLVGVSDEERQLCLRYLGHIYTAKQE